jgi:hypothetical protein
MQKKTLDANTKVHHTQNWGSHGVEYNSAGHLGCDSVQTSTECFPETTLFKRLHRIKTHYISIYTRFILFTCTAFLNAANNTFQMNQNSLYISPHNQMVTVTKVSSNGLIELLGRLPTKMKEYTSEVEATIRQILFLWRVKSGSSGYHKVHTASWTVE